MGRMTLSIADWDGEKSNAGFPCDDMTAANSDSIYALGVTLQNATMAISRGKLITKTHVAKISPQGVGRADDEEAQREEKALVKYYDDTTFERATLEIPCADMGLQNPNYPGVFFLDGADDNPAEWIAFVAAFEAFVPGPGGNDSVVETVIHVGRDL